jgi:hypothetical protein
MLAYICAHCENADDPVTKENGVVTTSKIGEGLAVAIYLHEKCVDAWMKEFGIAETNEIEE